MAIDGHEIGQQLLKHQTAANLIKYLALADDQWIADDVLMNAFWQEGTDRQLRNNLNQAIFHARRILEPKGQPLKRQFLLRHNGLVALGNEYPYCVDVHRFKAAAQNARKCSTIATYEEAIMSYTGDLLPADQYKSWCLAPHFELRGLFILLVTELAQLLWNEQRSAEAIHYLTQLIGRYPTHESTYQLLMQWHLATGNQYEALRVHQLLVKALATIDLDIDLASVPLLSTLPLPSSIEEISPAVAVVQPHHVLSPKFSLRTQFIGRQAELHTILQLCSQHRLVTLNGVGGIGKTRLAQIAGETIAKANKQPFYFVDLAMLPRDNDSAAILHSIALHFEAAVTAEADIIDHLRQHNPLLVFDNCEHIKESVCLVSELLLDMCPQIHIITTSRRPLEAIHEYVWNVPPLSLPSLKNLPPFKDLIQYDAIALFLARAEYASGYQLRPIDAHQLVTLCHHLDGLPLSIELTAARTRIFEISVILARIFQSLDLIQQDGFPHAQRHRTLTTTIDWSYQLLSDQAQQVFRRLSIFNETWSLEDAQNVCCFDLPQNEAPWQVIEELLQDNLIVSKETPIGKRFFLLQTLRTFALDQLRATFEYQRIVERFSQYRCQTIADLVEQLRGPKRQEMFLLFDHLHADTRFLLVWLYESEAFETVLQLANNYGFYWYVRGFLQEGHQWFSQLLQLTVDVSHSPFLPSTLMDAYIHFGWIALLESDFTCIDWNVDNAIALATLLHDDEIIMNALSIRAEAFNWQGRYDEAAPLLETLVTYAETEGNPRKLAVKLSNYADNLVDRDLIDQAQPYYARSLAIGQSIADSDAIGRAYTNLARVAYFQHRFHEADLLLAAATPIVRGLKYDRGMGEIALLQACNARALQQATLAFSKLSEALTWYQRAGLRYGIIACCEEYARLAVLVDNMTTAIIAWSAAQFQRRHYRLQGTSSDRTPLNIEDVHQSMDKQAYLEAWNTGQAFSFAALTEWLHVHISQWGQHTGKLTPREQQVRTYIEQGLTNRQIAEQLSISPLTVRSHIANLYKKISKRDPRF